MASGVRAISPWLVSFSIICFDYAMGSGVGIAWDKSFASKVDVTDDVAGLLSSLRWISSGVCADWLAV